MNVQVLVWHKAPSDFTNELLIREDKLISEMRCRGLRLEEIPEHTAWIQMSALMCT